MIQDNQDEGSGQPQLIKGLAINQSQYFEDDPQHNVSSFSHKVASFVNYSPKNSKSEIEEELNGSQGQLLNEHEKKKGSSLKQEELKLEFTFWDKVFVIGYNMIEPTLTSVLFGAAIELAELATCVYTLLTFCVLLPFLLTESTSGLKAKSIAAYIITFTAFLALLTKMWIYLYWTPTPKIHQSPIWMQAIGVYQDQWWFTFTNDIVVFVCAVLLILHFRSQLFQLERRNLIKAKKYQVEIKFRHSLFGEARGQIFIAACALYFFDTLLYQSILGLVVMTAILIYTAGFAFGQNSLISQNSLSILLSISLGSILLSFTLRIPTIINREEEAEWIVRTLEVLGLEIPLDSGVKLKWYTRIHRFFVCFACVYSLTFFVANKIRVSGKGFLINKIKQVSKINELYNNPELLGESNIKGIKMKFQEKKKLTLAEYWVIIRLPVWLNVCRFINIFVAYRYHDWLSLVPLLWVLHSAIMIKREVFVKISLYVYLPLMSLCYIFYYTINIDGLINQSKIQLPLYFDYGFYFFQNPYVEFPIIFSGILSIAVYCRFNIQDKFRERPMMRVLLKHNHVIYSWVYLSWVNVEIVVFIYAVIFSLITVDIYHIVILIMMVIAQYKPSFYNKSIFLLILYNSVFILGKYIFTLLYHHVSEDASYWPLIIGFYTPTYNPVASASIEFMRYQPPYASWFLLCCWLLQYTRNKILGFDQELIDVKMQRAEEKIAIYNPTIYKAYKYYTILENHVIVIFTFFVYLTLIFYLRRTFLNLGTLFFIFILLGAYLNNGLGLLLKLWHSLTVYQAFVLLSLLAVQFILYTQDSSSINYGRLVGQWGHLSDYQKALCHYAGFYRNQSQLYKELLPYVFMYFYAIVAKAKFARKYELENKDLTKDDDQPQFQGEKRVSSFLMTADSKETNSFEMIKPNQQLEEDFALKQAELTALKDEMRYYNMQYKLKYIVWKTQKLWPLFDFISLNFGAVMMSFLLFCALYYSIAGIWMVFFLIYMVQTWWMQREHRKYIKKQVKEFKEQKLPHNWETREFLSAAETRLNKLTTLVNRTKEGDKESLEEQIKAARSDADSKYAKQPRLLVTDEEACIANAEFKSDVYKLTLGSRYYFWVTQFNLLTLSMVIIYCAAFMIFPTTQDNSATLVPDNWDTNKIFFILFWFGFYRPISLIGSDSKQVLVEQHGAKFFSPYWPFFALLLLLIFEKLCQIWLRDKFGTKEEMIEDFKVYTERHNEIKADQRAKRLAYKQEKEKARKEQQMQEEKQEQDSLADLESEQSKNSDSSSPKNTDANFDLINIDPEEEQQKVEEKKILDELMPLLYIKGKLEMKQHVRFVAEEFVIALVFLSLIYKQSIFSFVLFFAVLNYIVQKFRGRTQSPTTLVRYCVITVLLLQYMLALTNLSSYNSPVSFPRPLTNSTTAFNTVPEVTGIYPNLNNTFFSVPFYFNFTQNTSIPNNQTNIPYPTVNVEVLNFFGIAVSGRILNGLWIDFIVVQLMFFLLNGYNLWLIVKPIKIVNSERTEELLAQYRKLKKNITWTNKQQQLFLLSEHSQHRLLKNILKNVYTTWSILVIIFFLMASISGDSLIAFGYFIFGMILIYLNKDLFSRAKTRINQIVLLKWFLLPYLLMDIFTQICFQIPIKKSENFKEWMSIVGLKQAWTFSPQTLYLGQNTEVVDIISPAIKTLIFRAALYYLIAIQLNIIQSRSFLKFYDKLLFQNAAQAKMIGKGMAYRYNNFKNQSLRSIADNYLELDQIISEVKKLIKRKNMLQQIQRQGNIENFQQQQQATEESKQTSSNGPKSGSVTPDQKSRSTELNLADQISNHTSNQKSKQQLDKIQEEWKELDYQETFQQEWLKQYNRELNKLSIGQKIYLWLRQRFVIDLLNKRSAEHLEDMLDQFKKGRTHVKTSLEIGLEVQSKTRVMNIYQRKLSKLLEQNKISEADFQTFILWKKEQHLKMELKPWEAYDNKTFLNGCTLTKDYFVMFIQIFTSNLHYLCFFWMLFAVMTNGGIIYMVYPFMIFGIALVDEERPGKTYWYFVLFYTQMILIVQYLVQLQIFEAGPNNNVDQDDNSIINWSQNHNFGIIRIGNSSFMDLFWKLFPDIALIISILITIQVETIAGIFDKHLFDYESFLDGLQRCKENQKVESGKLFDQEFTASRLLKDKVNLVDKNFKKLESKSETDWFMESYFFKQQEIDSNLDQIDDQMFNFNPQEQSLTLDDEIRKYKLKYRPYRPRSRSADLSSLNTNLKKNLYSRVKLQAEKYTSFVYDNSFFDRLFPRIKQQKPGKDLYTSVAALSIFIIFYIILFTNGMMGYDTSVAEQFSGNAISGTMVFSMMIMMGVMVIDRFFYTAAKEQNRKCVEKKLKTNEQLNQPELNDENTIEDRDKFLDWLQPQYLTKSMKRTLRFYFLWIVMIWAHWYIFFYLTNDDRVCFTSNPYCNKFSENGFLILFYLCFCAYFTLQASQIQYGLPELKKGGFLIGNYSPVSKAIFKVWYNIPFLFELRTILDWTFTHTGLDVFQSILLAQIQADLFVAKCYNKPYMAHPLGEKRKWFLKIGIGGVLMLFVLTLIAGPMVLFSNLNPILQANPVSNIILDVYVELQNRKDNTLQILPLFYTDQQTMSSNLTQTQFNQMNFQSDQAQTDLFNYDQVQAVQMQSLSNTIWKATEPKKNFVSYILQQLADNNQTTMDIYNANLVFQAQFKRPTIQSYAAVFKSVYTLGGKLENENVTRNLSLAIKCNQPSTIVNIEEARQQYIQLPNDIDFSIAMDQFGNIVQLQTARGYETVEGYTLIYTCHPFNFQHDEQYWSLFSTFRNSLTTSVYEQIFTGGQGFCFFLFNQSILPEFLTDYSSSVLLFYAGVVYLIAGAFRQGVVPATNQIFIINAPETEKILNICQCIYIYRMQKNLANEEELYFILLEIVRQPQMIHELCGSSLKTKLGRLEKEQDEKEELEGEVEEFGATVEQLYQVLEAY